MTRPTLLAALLLFTRLGLADAGGAGPSAREEYLKAFEARARYLTAPYDTSLSGGYFAIASHYAHGVQVAQADSAFLALLREPHGDMFWMFPVIGAYMHGKDKMAPGVREAVRNAWKTYAPYRGDTENHWAMYYASLFVAAEQWPGLPGSEWFNGKSSDENRQEAADYLVHWIRLTTTIGQGEFDSPDYFPEYINAMMILAEFAQDSAMRRRGAMMLDYFLADFAVEHLDGQYLGGFSRVYQPAVYKPLLSGAAGFAFLYFGTGEQSQLGWAVLPALGRYRLPQVIYDIATDRSAPYVERERKRVRNVIRFGTERNPPVYKYTYVTKDYGLGSLQGGLLQPIQQHTWGVRFTAGRPFTTIFGLHPYWSSFELGMFFPEELKPLIADVVTSKGTYNNPDKWTGGSPYERTFQQKNTLLVLYDIPPGTTTEHIDGFFPANLEERDIDPSGWIFCKAGDTYVGWYPLQPAVWMEEQDAPGQALSTTTGRPEQGAAPPAARYWRLRSYARQNGYVIEARSRAEAGSFDRFRASLRTRVPRARLTPGAVSVEYRSLGNGTMAFAFPDVRTLDGKPVDLSRCPLFESPFLHAAVGSEQLIMTAHNKRRTLDFKTLTITDQP